MGPVWRVAALAVVGVSAFVICPAIGVGLWLPSRNMRTAVIVTTIAASVMWILPSLWPGILQGAHIPRGLPGVQAPPAPDDSACFVVPMVTGLGLLAVFGVFGVLWLRRRGHAGPWLGAGVLLTLLQTTEAICPRTGGMHVLLHHGMPAIACAAVAGVLAHPRAAPLHRALRARLRGH